jgi:hypothetical protein
VDLYIHSPVSLHDVVPNGLSTDITLPYIYCTVLYVAPFRSHRKTYIMGFLCIFSAVTLIMI